jgi:hypothetical protein
MAALVCEICGGKLIAKAGGLFECEFCGVQYDTAWAKAKVQEIKGTVQVEGTVEVTGTVKLDGPVEVKGGVTLENLLKRAKHDMVDGNWTTAKKRFDEALNLNPECAEAHFGLAMCTFCVSGLENLVRVHQWNNSHYARGKHFASADLREQVQQLEERCLDREKRERIAREQQENEARMAKEMEEKTEYLSRMKEYERKVREQREREERIRQWQAWECAGLCRFCGGKFKGLFTKVCIDCGKEKDY